MISDRMSMILDRILTMCSGLAISDRMFVALNQYLYGFGSDSCDS